MSFIQRYEPECGKMPYLAMLKNPSKNFLEVDPEADDIPNLISSSWSKHTSLVKFS